MAGRRVGAPVTVAAGHALAQASAHVGVPSASLVKAYSVWPSASTMILPSGVSASLQRRAPGPAPPSVAGRRGRGDRRRGGRLGSRRRLHQLGVGADDEPHVAAALAVGVTGSGVARVGVQRELAGDELLGAVVAQHGAEDAGVEAGTDGPLRVDDDRRPRLGARAVAGALGVDVVGEAVEREAVGPDQDLAGARCRRPSRRPARRRRGRPGRPLRRRSAGAAVGESFEPPPQAARPTAARATRAKRGFLFMVQIPPCRGAGRDRQYGGWSATVLADHERAGHLRVDGAEERVGAGLRRGAERHRRAAARPSR